MTTTWVFDDGGRAAAGFKGETEDCVTRALAIATLEGYGAVYAELHAALRADPRRARAENPRRRSPRNGVPRRIYDAWLRDRGWIWTPTMFIGSGCRVHLRADELPSGTVIARCSTHLVTVLDGIIHDTYDSTRGGTRCVYGYWQPPGSPPPSL